MEEMAGADPTATARALFAAMAEGRGFDVAALVHPHSAEMFKTTELHFASEAEMWHQRGLELAAEDPDRIPPPERLSYRNQYRVASIAELQQMSASHMIARAAESESQRNARREVLGHVMESSDTAHVVYRLTEKFRDIESESIPTTTMKLLDGRWLSQDIGNLNRGWRGWPPS